MQTWEMWERPRNTQVDAKWMDTLSLRMTMLTSGVLISSEVCEVGSHPLPYFFE